MNSLVNTFLKQKSAALQNKCFSEQVTFRFSGYINKPNTGATENLHEIVERALCPRIASRVALFLLLVTFDRFPCEWWSLSPSAQGKISPNHPRYGCYFWRSISAKEQDFIAFSTRSFGCFLWAFLTIKFCGLAHFLHVSDDAGPDQRNLQSKPRVNASRGGVLKDSVCRNNSLTIQELNTLWLG